MDPQSSTALVTGGFTIAGGVAVAILSALLGRSGEKRKVKVDDDRRWLMDRRTVYAKYLGLAEVMLREIDGIAAFLSYDGKDKITPEDEAMLAEGLSDYFAKWEESLQPLLGEVQLLAVGEVADLADRVSGALMDVTWRIEKPHSLLTTLPGFRPRTCSTSFVTPCAPNSGFPPSAKSLRGREATTGLGSHLALLTSRTSSSSLQTSPKKVPPMARPLRYQRREYAL